MSEIILKFREHVFHAFHIRFPMQSSSQYVAPNSGGYNMAAYFDQIHLNTLEQNESLLVFQKIINFEEIKRAYTRKLFFHFISEKINLF